MAKISMVELAAAAKEMNSVMGLQPKIKTVGVPEKALTEAIKVNAEEIDPETDEFSEETIDTLKALGAWPGEEVDEETDPDEEIEDAENEDVVVKMRAEKEKGKKQPAASKAPVKGKKKPEPEPDPEDEEIEEDEEEEDDKPVAPVKGKKVTAAPAKAEKKANPKFEKPAYSRIASVCDALKAKPKTINDWAEKSNELMEKNGGKANLNEAKTLIKFVSAAVAAFAPDVKLPLA